MSVGGHPPDPDESPDDPFAFPGDDRPAAPDGPPYPGQAGSASDEGRARSYDPTPQDDPFAFPDDGGPEDHPASPGEDAATGSAPGVADGRAPATPPPGRPAPSRPPARKGRRGARRAGAPASPDDEHAARLRTVADEASAHARAVGARWLAGAVVVFLILVVVTTVSGGPDGDGGDVQPGERLPEFAAPLVSEPRLQDNEDVNLATEDGQGEAGNTAACSIRNRSVVTSCGLLARGPLVVVVFSRGVDSCVRAVDLVDAERRRFPGLQALAVSLLGRHDSTGEAARDRRWTLPVVYDRDGALGSVLGVPACPLVLFVRRDGTVDRRIIGELDRTELTTAMRRLVAPVAPARTTVDSTPSGR